MLEELKKEFRAEHEELFTSAVNMICRGASQMIDTVPKDGSSSSEGVDEMPWRDNSGEAPDVVGASRLQVGVACLDMAMRLWERSHQLTQAKAMLKRLEILKQSPVQAVTIDKLRASDEEKEELRKFFDKYAGESAGSACRNDDSDVHQDAMETVHKIAEAMRKAWDETYPEDAEDDDDDEYIDEMR